MSIESTIKVTCDQCGRQSEIAMRGVFIDPIQFIECEGFSETEFGLTCNSYKCRACVLWKAIKHAIWRR